MVVLCHYGPCGAHLCVLPFSLLAAPATVQALCGECGLTPRSSGAPTAWRQVRADAVYHPARVPGAMPLGPA